MKDSDNVKRKRKRTQQTIWRNQRRNAIRREFPMLTESTIMEYDYRIERSMKVLARGQLVVWLKEEGWHKKKKYIITLKGRCRLQRQSRNKITITVMDVETKKRMEISYKALLNSRRWNQNIEL